VHGDGVKQVIPGAELATDGVVDHLLEAHRVHHGTEVDEGAHEPGARDRRADGGIGEVQVLALVAATELDRPGAEVPWRDDLRDPAGAPVEVPQGRGRAV
jgi:hypothetical protein